MPIHFDIAAAESKMRADTAQATIEGQKLIDDGKADPALLRAQREFDEARIQFVLAGMRCDNAGVDRKDQLAAAGFTIGTIWVNALGATISAHERAVLNGWLSQALAQGIGTQEAQKTVKSVFAPMEAGHA